MESNRQKVVLLATKSMPLRFLFTLPQISTTKYDEATDEKKGGNILISMNEKFGDVRLAKINVRLFFTNFFFLFL
jgi:hypothetical protein